MKKLSCFRQKRSGFSYIYWSLKNLYKQIKQPSNKTKDIFRLLLHYAEN